MNPSRDKDAPTGNGERVFVSADGKEGAPGHDIPHPIGDPDEDEGLPGDDDDDTEDDEDEDDEEPLQVHAGITAWFLHRSTQSKFLL